MIDFLNLRQVNAPHEAGFGAALQRVLHSGWYILGEETAAFESRTNSERGRGRLGLRGLRRAARSRCGGSL